MNVVWVTSGYDYAYDMSRDLESMAGVTIVDGVAFRSSLARLLVGGLRRFSPAVALRLGQAAFARRVGGAVQKTDEPPTICLFDSAPFAADPHFLELLRKANPGCRLVAIILNTLTSPDRRECFRELYDVAYSFDPRDASCFGFKHFDGLYSTGGSRKPKTQYDLVFIGTDKGRFDALCSLFDTISRQGRRCFFYVVSDRREFARQDGFMVSRRRLPYSEWKSLARSANCILDLLPENQAGLSLRSIEAIAFGTRLLTNSKWVAKSRWFDPSRMSIFDESTEIEIDFVANQDPLPANYAGEFSPRILLNSILSGLDHQSKPSCDD